MGTPKAVGTGVIRNGTGVVTVEEFRILWDKKNGGKPTPHTNEVLWGPRKSASSEHALQVACVNLFRAMYPEYAGLLFAIPNGGYRTPTTARYMKAEGQLAGVPDIFLAVSRNKRHGLWIEMKNGKAGRVSEAQTEMMKRLWEQGYECRIARSMEDFESIVREYLR